MKNSQQKNASLTMGSLPEEKKIDSNFPGQPKRLLGSWNIWSSLGTHRFLSKKGKRRSPFLWKARFHGLMMKPTFFRKYLRKNKKYIIKHTKTNYILRTNILRTNRPDMIYFQETHIILKDLLYRHIFMK